MAEFERERMVAAGADEVFDIAADVERIEQWMPPEVSVPAADGRRARAARLSRERPVTRSVSRARR